jgi:glycosyltransferase involved in cell wall biosynthesis
VPEPDVDVSIIVAVHNGASTIAQCIESVLSQTGCSTELLVFDALSDDATQAIVASYARSNVTYVRAADQGIYDAWNQALTVARGEWCAFLGADDFFISTRSVAVLLSCARESAEPPAFVHGGIVRIGGPEEYVIHPAPPDPLKYLRKGKMLPHQGFLHHVGALRSIGGFDASFRIAGDFEAAIRLLDGGASRRCDEVVTAMRVGGVGSTREHRRSRQRECLTIIARDQGLLRAVQMYVTKRSAQLLIQGVEGLILAALGRQRGQRMIVTWRKRVGRAPELL